MCSEVVFGLCLRICRAHGVRRNRPITLPVTSTSPALDTTHERGLQYLASVFRPLNEIFFAVWNGSTQECSKDWLLRLEDDVRSALPVVLSVSNEEITNLRVSQFWLRIKVWELFPRFGFLSTESVYECLTFRYPVVVARDLTVLAMKLPIASFQVHGIGMVRSIFLHQIRNCANIGRRRKFLILHVHVQTYYLSCLLLHRSSNWVQLTISFRLHLFSRSFPTAHPSSYPCSSQK